MPHMIPEYQHGHWYEVEGPDGTEWIPADLIKGNHIDNVVEWMSENHLVSPFPPPAEIRDYCQNREVYDIIARDAMVGARLSAPGYLDSTDWSVFNTRKEAEDHIRETYDVDPETGESLMEDDDG